MYCGYDYNEEDDDSVDSDVISVGDYGYCKPEVIYNYHTAEKACDFIRKDCIHHRFVGFDCEWKPTYIKGARRNKVALVQIATPKSGDVFLFHLASMGRVPQGLVDLLEDYTIIKVGVNPSQDKTNLYEDYNIEVASTLDLCCLYNRMNSLKTFAWEMLEIDVNKSSRLTNWEQYPLSWDSICYAAIDAYVSAELFKDWAGLDSEMRQPFWRDIKPLIEEYYDLSFWELRRQDRGNCCVVCGDDEDLINKHVVPKMYTSWFENDSDDILLMCNHCNGYSAEYTSRLNYILKFVAGFPLPARICEEIRQEKESAIFSYNTPTSVTSKFLRDSQCWWRRNEHLADCRQGLAGEKIVEYFQLNRQPLSKLQDLWRKMFVESMDPQFLPNGFLSNLRNCSYY